MKIIGLTGGIGSGKSTVLNLFKALGVETYVADIEAKKLMSTDLDLKKEICALFGNEAYLNNELNRAYIASVVFNNSDKLQELNSLVHPKVRAHFQNFIKNCNANLVIYEAAILFESGNHTMCDYIITVTADLEERLKRVSKRDGVTKQQVLERMNHQISDEFRIQNSNFVIKNNDLESTKTQVLTVFDLLQKMH
ncbi:dephospho-CoA kinase [Lutibacter sp. HS1-25]|uniref:dephospho-CoA kinase n=1 Tax=Lutibacter sp. HS1-25 TaxID=2485000 RepID=UPI001013661D|nr:dephospho-CoA kinase [Lutibacter sp. HS1-25]RXP52330.1 dephospho-CoA kinase [Lutibacter sp. HS1-25]